MNWLTSQVVSVLHVLGVQGLGRMECIVNDGVHRVPGEYMTSGEVHTAILAVDAKPSPCQGKLPAECPGFGIFYRICLDQAFPTTEEVFFNSARSLTLRNDLYWIILPQVSGHSLK